MPDDPRSKLSGEALAFYERSMIKLNEPRWSGDHERAVERSQATLIDPELVAEAEEIERLAGTHEGRRKLASRMAAKHIRIAAAAASQVKYVGPGNYQCRPAPDNRTAGQELNYAAELLGLKAPVETKIQLTGEWQKLPDDEVNRRYEEMIAKAIAERGAK